MNQLDRGLRRIRVRLVIDLVVRLVIDLVARFYFEVVSQLDRAI
jgi:hypothetical protein